MKKILILSLLAQISFAAQSVKKFNWNGVDVVWLESQKFPKFDVVVYVGDGALADSKDQDGYSKSMFSLLSNGTSKYSQKVLADKFDFYASGISSQVTHEYSTLGFSGLAKDAKELTNLFCHVIKEANFPKSEIDSFKKRSFSQLNNLVASHSALANRVFRRVSLDNTPYNSYVGGSIKSLSKLSRSDLLRKKNYFNDNVYKKIFISGPKEVLAIESIFKDKCEWSGQAKFKRASNVVAKRVEKVNKDLKQKLYFLPLPGANQAQIRLGSYLPISVFEGEQFDLTKLTSSILGGGFTSLLMQELRVKRGLTYGAGAQAASQATYGRSFISTSTKSETLLEALYTIRDTLKALTSGTFPDERVIGVRKLLKGKHLLKFESDASYINNLVLFDHLGKSYEDLSKFPQVIDKFMKADVVKNAKNLYDWNEQVIFVLGAPKLKAQLEKAKLFDVIELNLKSYL